MSESKVKKLRQTEKEPELTLEEMFDKAVKDKLYYADNNGEVGLQVKLSSAENITQLVSVRNTFAEFFNRIPTCEESNTWANFVIDLYKQQVEIVQNLKLEDVLKEDFANPVQAILNTKRESDDDLFAELLGFLNIKECVLWMEQLHKLCMQKAKNDADTNTTVL